MNVLAKIKQTGGKKQGIKRWGLPGALRTYAF